MRIVDGKDYLPQVKELIIEYIARLGRDLQFQNLDEELANPGEKYTAPNGEILVALNGETPVGMVAYHRHNNDRCEMKRLYLTPACRGKGVGLHLVEEILAHAKVAGYKEMVLDTIPPLQSALALYKKAGFIPCDAYYHNPMPDVIYMRKFL